MRLPAGAAQRAFRLAGQHRLHIAELPGEEAGQAPIANELTDAQVLVNTEEPGGGFHTPGMTHQPGEERPLPKGGRALLLHMAHRQHQIRRVQPHRADGSASLAVEAGVHLRHQVAAEVQFPFQSLACQRDPSAGRGRLGEVFAVGRADRQAQPAPDAVQVFVFSGLFNERLMFHAFTRLSLAAVIRIPLTARIAVIKSPC